MFGLKCKMFWLFTIASILLIGLGGYFYLSLASVEQLAKTSMSPNIRSYYLKNISLNLNKLNNLYLIDSVRLSERRVDSLINAIEEDIFSLNFSYKDQGFLYKAEMDSIPELLQAIKDDYISLEARRRRSNQEFYTDLEESLKQELAGKNISTRDSITIVQRITSEVFNNPVEIYREPAQAGQPEQEQPERRSFFQRLFGGSRSSEADKDARPQETDPTPQVLQKDTVITEQIDTILPLKSPPAAPEETPLTVFKIFEEVQTKRLAALEELKYRERQIFTRNTEITTFIENMLNRIFLDEIESFESSVQELSTNTKRQAIISAFVVLVFIVLSLLSLFRILRDIDKNVAYQNLLKRNEERAQRDAKDKQRFLAMMSHELRTPLTSIIGYSELLEGEDENVKAIQSASNYLYSMTNEILDMAKIQADIIEIRPAPCNLLSVFIEIERNFRPLIENAGLRAGFNFPGEPIWVEADSYRVQQVVYNLMHNAVKYTESGFINLGVVTGTFDNDVTIEVKLEDSGIGMSEEEMKTIFEDYQQAGTHKNKMKGTGLGLGIVKKVVNEMGGNMTLESKVDEGTLFVINFQFPKVDEVVGITSPVALTEIPDNALAGYSIFSIDDDPLITRLYGNILQRYGCTYTSMNDPLKALHHLLENDYDLIIFDFKMPNMSGYELISELTKANRKPPISVISTANVLLSDEQKSQIEIFDQIIYKPLKQDFVISTIYRLITGLTPGEAPVTSSDQEAKRYSLEDLEEYADGDPAVLEELLYMLLDENDAALSLLAESVENQQTKEAAELIHKLASRFAQIRVHAPFDLRELQNQLLANEKGFLKKARELTDYWKGINEEIKAQNPRVV